MANNPNASANLVPFRRGIDPRRRGNGRPRGRRNLSSIVRNLMESPITWKDIPFGDTSGYRLKFDGLVPWEAIVYVAVGQALSGDIMAMEWLRKAAYGNKVDIPLDSQRPGISQVKELTIRIAER